ncbi:MAG: hypothetical protein E6Q97_14505 [Desulfurellales bacterium]|nr:MAG: hypothetical protein E6Q97_14505 [Desulfurellales bacterium]
MYAEVLALIEAREQTDEQFAALVAARADAQEASALSENRYKLKKGTFIGVGTIVELLGRSGANLLRAMRNAAPQDPLIDEGVRLIDAGRWDIGSQATHNALDEIVAAGAMPAYVATALKNLGRTPDLIPTAVVTDVLDRRAQGVPPPVDGIAVNDLVRVLPPFDSVFPGTYRVLGTSPDAIELEGVDSRFAPHFLEPI